MLANNYFFLMATINWMATFVVGALIFLKDTRDRRNKAFFLMTSCIALWALLYSVWVVAPTEQAALFWARAWIGAAALIPVALLNFNVELLDPRARWSNRIILAFYALLLPFMFLSLTPLVSPRVSPSGYFVFWPEPSNLFHVYLTVWTLAMLYSFWLVYKGFSLTNAQARQRWLLILMGIAISGLSDSSGYVFMETGVPLVLPYILAASGLVYIPMSWYGMVRYGIYSVSVRVAAKTIVETMADALFVVDSHLNVSSVNTATKAMLGVTEEEILRQPIEKLLPGATEIINEQHESGDRAVAEMELPTPSGNVPVSVSVGRVRRTSGDCYVLICRDISQQKLHLATIDDQRKKLSAILLGIGDGVFVVDRSGRVVLTNPMALQMAGRTGEDVTGRPFAEVFRIVAGQGRKVADGFILEAMERNAITYSPLQSCIVGGPEAELPVAVSSAPLIGPSGIFGAVAIMRDERREREIEELKSEFVSIASHQLKAPLTAIRWLLETVLQGDNGEVTSQQKESLEAALVSNMRMIALVGDLLNVSRIDDGRVAVNPAPTDLSQLCAEVVTEIQPAAEGRKVRVENQCWDLGVLNTDRKLIFQVLANLLSNAIKYSRDGGLVTIQGERQQFAVMISVKDDGIGIPESQQKKIFSKFFRASNAVTSKVEGTGLGLYIVKSIVESSGGSISFESSEGKGSTFKISLPIAGSPAKSGEHGLTGTSTK